MELSSKVGNRNQLLMLFNEVDGRLNQKIREKELKRAEENYFRLLEIYGEEVMNEAKRELCRAVSQCMARVWMHGEAQARQFTEQPETKKEIFEKYLNHFRQELAMGEGLASKVYRQDVM
jgi:hypothetical protein